ncbi:MAG: hypothetical protein C4527_29025 [Candidatus Omnitrophota bacterium]|jgi:hypothetical protein|nr:MAG: hypothetical protein C4527_29025 [Candidatus Omnitrophota bacterium]
MKQSKPNLQPYVAALFKEAQSNRNRLAKLERWNRILMIFMVLLILSGGVFVYLVVSPNKIITARQYIAADEAGTYRGILGPSGLIVLDEATKKKAQLSVRQDGLPVLTLFDDAETIRCELSRETDGIPHLRFYDEKQNLRASLQLTLDGEFGLIQFDDTGRETILYPPMKEEADAPKIESATSVIPLQ